MIAIDGESVRFINPDLYEARAVNGAAVIFAYHTPVCIALVDGQCFKRLKKMEGDTGRKVEAKLDEIAAREQWNGAMRVTECSEREFAEVERTLADGLTPPTLPQLAQTRDLPTG